MNTRYYIQLPGETLETVLTSEVGYFTSINDALEYLTEELPLGADYTLLDSGINFLPVFSGKVEKILHA